ncbi:hypothetical protein Fcan01_22765 [Folsomia candida]|uniref:Uncharacterized protein n=1 Tax=Folsomia candida TaxID=158441 RepID=A0A226DCF1_FOLCA|nr:hypothetical protein Fcan01_22765 [Folsomia candida]
MPINYLTYDIIVGALWRPSGPQRPGQLPGLPAPLTGPSYCKVQSTSMNWISLRGCTADSKTYFKKFDPPTFPHFQQNVEKLPQLAPTCQNHHKAWIMWLSGLLSILGDVSDRFGVDKANSLVKIFFLCENLLISRAKKPAPNYKPTEKERIDASCQKLLNKTWGKVAIMDNEPHVTADHSNLPGSIGHVSDPVILERTVNHEIYLESCIKGGLDSFITKDHKKIKFCFGLTSQRPMTPKRSITWRTAFMLCNTLGSILGPIFGISKSSKRRLVHLEVSGLMPRQQGVTHLSFAVGVIKLSHHALPPQGNAVALTISSTVCGQHETPECVFDQDGSRCKCVNLEESDCPADEKCELVDQDTNQQFDNICAQLGSTYFARSCLNLLNSNEEWRMMIVPVRPDTLPNAIITDALVVCISDEACSQRCAAGEISRCYEVDQKCTSCGKPRVRTIRFRQFLKFPRPPPSNATSRPTAVKLRMDNPRGMLLGHPEALGPTRTP